MFSKTLLVVFIVYFLSDFSHGQRDKTFFRNDYHYIESSESFYKFHTVMESWRAAKQICAQEGAALFYPDDDEETEAVISFWNTTQPQVKSVSVGMSDLTIKGLFDTVNGKPVSEVYNKWGPGQPDNKKVNYYDTEDEDCVELFQDGYLNDMRCSCDREFICKKSLQTLQWNYECNLPNLDYTLNTDIGKCYKLHTTPLKWNDAYVACRREQTTLAVISDQKELDYLVKLTEAAPKLRIGANYQKGIFHLGFHDQNNEGWQTIKGVPMNDPSAWWGNEQPDVDDGKQCGSMFYTGLLNNVNCDTKSFFICEHEVDVSNWSEAEEDKELVSTTTSPDIVSSDIVIPNPNISTPSPDITTSSPYFVAFEGNVDFPQNSTEVFDV